MNANDLRAKANQVTDRKRLDIVYNEILLPKLKRCAENKQKELQIYENCYDHQVWVRLKELGFNDNLQYICRGVMLPYLTEKGFNVTYSPYFTYIKF
jgi:hypothetical protein